VSGEHARVIVKTLHAFPPDLTAEELTDAEHTLVQLARQARPPEVATAGARYLAYLRPDGTLASADRQDRARELLLRPRPDGSYDLTGRLTPACGAQLLATLTPRSAPRRADPVRRGRDRDHQHDRTAIPHPPGPGPHLLRATERCCANIITASSPAAAGAASSSTACPGGSHPDPTRLVQPQCRSVRRRARGATPNRNPRKTTE